MNSYKLNGMSGSHFRRTICEGLKIHHTEIYKVIKDVDSQGVITTRDGKKYKCKLEEIKNEN